MLSRLAAKSIWRNGSQQNGHQEAEKSIRQRWNGGCKSEILTRPSQNQVVSTAEYAEYAEKEKVLSKFRVFCVFRGQKNEATLQTI
jgi:hypothetical protein